MRKHWQKTLGAGIFVLLAVGVWLGLGAVHEWGMGFGEFRRLQEQLDRLRRVEAAIDAERDHMRAWADLKTRSMEDLIDGRRTLRDVAREWRDRGAISAFCRQYFRDKYPSRSEDELVCRYVLWYAKGYLGDGLEADAVVLGLERELQAALGRGGPLLGRDEGIKAWVRGPVLTPISNTES